MALHRDLDENELMWNSHNFLLTFIAVEKHFIVSPIFILKLYFLRFVPE